MLKRLLYLFAGLFIFLILQMVQISLVLGQDATEPLQTITAQNAHRLALLKTLGRGDIWDMAASEDGQMIVTSNLRDIWIFKKDSSSETWKGPTRLGLSNAVNIALNPDSTLLAIATNGSKNALYGQVVLWDLKTNKQRSTIENPNKGFVSHVMFSPDGQRFVFASGDDLYLWNVKSEKRLAVLKGHTNDITDLAFSPDSTLLASTDYDFDAPTVRIWDLKNLSPSLNARNLLRIQKSHWVSGLAFMPDNKSLLLAYGGDPDGADTISVRDINTDEEKRTIGSHPWPVAGIAVSSDGALAASGGAVGSSEIRLWDVTQGRLLFSLKGEWKGVANVMFLSHGTLLAAAYSVGIVRLWDTRTGKLVSIPGGYGSHAVLGSHADQVYSVSFSADSALLASGGTDGTVRLWNVATEEEIAVLESNDYTVRSVSFSPDKTLLASAGDDNIIRLWDIPSKSVRTTLQGHSKPVEQVVFSPDGKLLASASQDGTVRLWNLQTGKDTLLVPSGGSSMDSVGFSPDGSTLAAGGSDDMLRLWDVRTLALLNTFETSDAITGVAFSSDGTLVACSHWFGELEFWTTKDRQKYAALHVGGKYLYSLAFSPNSQILASGSRYDLELWDTRTLSTIKFDPARPRMGDSFQYTLEGLTFSPNGKILAFGNDDGTIELWGVVGRANF